jgi:RNA ligase (TIGR02306 family)
MGLNKMERKLASICKILNLEPIAGADKIEKATVLGWQCVVVKNQFSVGDLCVFHEIDSFLPMDNPAYDFLKPKGVKKNNDGVEGIRLKTIRLKGQISQGLAMPMSILKGIKLPTDKREGEQEYNWKEGRDVSKFLGVIQWQPHIPLCLSGVVKGPFPGFLPKTDETRVQLLQPVLDKWKGLACYLTEKLDGSSATFYMKDGQFGVCSRNLELKESEENAFWKMAKKLKIEENLRKWGLDNLAFQGELCGPGIQENSLALKDFDVYFFNMYGIKEGKYMSRDDLEYWCNKLELRIVPDLGPYILFNDIPSIVKLATRKSVINPAGWAEGIVIRPEVEVEDREFMNVLNYNRLSFKCINPEFLIEVEK